MSTQDAFLQRLELIAEEADLDIRIDKSWANVGHVHFCYRDELQPIASLRFDFQTAWQTATFRFWLPQGVAKEEKRHCRFDDDSLDKFLDYLKVALVPEHAR